MVLPAVFLLVTSCSEQTKEEKRSQEKTVAPKTECLVPTTPVKNQGNSSLCWIYAMLATIESEHLMMGDSVNLSPHFVARSLLEEEAERVYLSKGKEHIRLRGMAQDLIGMIQRHGLTHFDSFRSEANYNVVKRKAEMLVRQYVGRSNGLHDMKKALGTLLDDQVHPELRFVFMLGAEYTPLEFAHSVCMDDEYVALTSFSHHEYGRPFVLDVPDNHGRHSFMNLPLDSLMGHIDDALQRGHPVCWEGDSSEPLFSFAQGIAKMETDSVRVTQQMRQQMFERLQTTDDHCMEMIGMARTPQGKRYYICKNSWGTENPFGGLMYLSENYVRAKTMAVWMSQRAYYGDDY